MSMRRESGKMPYCTFGEECIILGYIHPKGEGVCLHALMVLILLCLSGAGLSVRLRCGAEEGILLSILGMIAAAYAAALAGTLPLAGVLPWVLGLAGAAFLAVSLVQKRWDELLDRLGGTLLFLLAGLALWWLCRGRALVDWDDFSHWGYALKVMFGTGGLYTAPGYGDGFASYPPASTLWQYLVLRAAGAGYREDLALWAHALLSVSMLLSAVRAMHKRRFGVKLVSFALLWMVLFQLYPRGITMLGVDLLLGMVLAAVLLAEFLPGRSRVTPLLEVLGCFVLCLVKSTGFGLALLAVGAVTLRRILLFWKRKKAGDARLLPFVTPAVMLAAGLAAHFSWAAHLSLMGVAERWQTDEPLIPAVWAFLTLRGPAYRFEVFRSFFRELFTAFSYGWAIRFPWVGWAAGALLLGAAAYFLSERRERKAVCAGVGASLGVAAVFTGSLLFTYLFLFQPSEAVLLASISRYLNTACAVMIIVAAAFAFTALSHRRLRSRWAAVVCVALLVLLAGQPKELTDAFGLAPLRAAETNEEAYPYHRAALRIRSLGAECPRVFLITSYDSGLAQLRIAYELLPWTLPTHGTMLMTENSESVPGAVQCTWQEWRSQLLDGFDYVYIYRTEPQFIREFSAVFEDAAQIMEDRMFRVVRTDADAILQNMPEITAEALPDC